MSYCALSEQTYKPVFHKHILKQATCPPRDLAIRSYGELYRSMEQLNRSMEQLNRSVQQLSRSVEQLNRYVEQLNRYVEQLNRFVEQSLSLWVTIPIVLLGNRPLFFWRTY